jgi:DNA-binding transcriptional ArsR family regulator
MARDLSQIYWLWNTLISQESDANLVIAVQKEMLGNHFFFNKMRIIEIEPLSPDQIIRVYLQTFHVPHPFTNEALTALAIMSRGIFRRFLRYVTLTLESWEILPDPRQPIDPALVKQTITIDRLAEDMELELAGLFPKRSDLRLQAVRLLMHLEESGPKKQAELAEELGLEGYAMSRLLAKLELHRYIVRRREGTDKIVSLREER